MTNAERASKFRAKQSQVKTQERRKIFKAAELAYLRDRQQAVKTQVFCSRIERLLTDHPRFMKRFTETLNECNRALKESKVS